LRSRAPFSKSILAVLGDEHEKWTPPSPTSSNVITTSATWTSDSEWRTNEFSEGVAAAYVLTGMGSRRIFSFGPRGSRD
jgi:hypothetical protein